MYDPPMPHTPRRRPRQLPRNTTLWLAIALLVIVGPGCVSWNPIVFPALRNLLALLGM